jgi:hypothetical protein
MLHAFLISALHASDWSASCSGYFIPKNWFPVPTGQEAGWTPELLWVFWKRYKFLPFSMESQSSIPVQCTLQTD